MKKVLLTHTSLNSFIIQPESYGATVDEGFIVGGPVGDFELLLCHGTVCVVGKMRDLILQLSKSSIYSTKPGCIEFPSDDVDADPGINLSNHRSFSSSFRTGGRPNRFPLLPKLFHKAPFNQAGYAHGPEVVRRGYDNCVRDD